MERQLPYAINYNMVTYRRKIEDGFLWGVFICQIILQLFQINSVNHLLKFPTPQKGGGKL